MAPSNSPRSAQQHHIRFSVPIYIEIEAIVFRKLEDPLNEISCLTELQLWVCGRIRNHNIAIWKDGGPADNWVVTAGRYIEYNPINEIERLRRSYPGNTRWNRDWKHSRLRVLSAEGAVVEHAAIKLVSPVLNGAGGCAPDRWSDEVEGMLRYLNTGPFRLATNQSTKLNVHIHHAHMPLPVMQRFAAVHVICEEAMDQIIAGHLRGKRKDDSMRSFRDQHRIGPATKGEVFDMIHACRSKAELGMLLNGGEIWPVHGHALSMTENWKVNFDTPDRTVWSRQHHGTSRHEKVVMWVSLLANMLHKMAQFSCEDLRPIVTTGNTTALDIIDNFLDSGVIRTYWKGVLRGQKRKLPSHWSGVISMVFSREGSDEADGEEWPLLWTM